MNVLDAGIYSLLAADSGAGGVATLATGGIFQLSVPQGTIPPYVLFEELIDNPNYNFGNVNSCDYIPYAFRAFTIDDVNASSPVSGPFQAGRLADRFRALFSNPSISVSGKSVISCRMLRSIPPSKEKDETGSRWIYSRGALVEMWVV